MVESRRDRLKTRSEARAQRLMSCVVGTFWGPLIDIDSSLGSKRYMFIYSVQPPAPAPAANTDKLSLFAHSQTMALDF